MPPKRAPFLDHKDRRRQRRDAKRYENNLNESVHVSCLDLTGAVFHIM
jgi:hypothetical protein